MQYQANSPDDYINQVPDDRKEPMKRLRGMINENIPKGFEETMSYGMIGYVVPHSIYPSGYHCDPKLPLPYMNLASQKNYIAVYHSGVYASKEILDWFTNEFAKRSNSKLDMGKSCIRFKKMDAIPYDLIGELASKITAQQWIDIYESNVKR